jgi:hypothetical protein
MAWNWVALERYQQRLASGRHLSAIGGSDFHQPDRLMPEGPLVLARPTTVLWLDELSEDAILAAMKAGHGYVTESPGGPHLEIAIGDSPMGSTVARSSVLGAHASVRGANGDRLHWIDASGRIGEQEIDADDWQGEVALLDGASGFVRAEIVAAASRERLVAEFLATTEGGALPWQLRGTDVSGQPLRRTISNPIYLER